MKKLIGVTVGFLLLFPGMLYAGSAAPPAVRGSVSGAPTNVTPVDTGDEDAAFYLLIVDGATGSQATETDGGLSYNPNTNTLSATQFSGGGAGVSNVDAATGDSATAFFDAGTIEHERGGLEADVSLYGGVVGISSGTTYDVNTSAEFYNLVTDPNGSGGYLTFSISPSFTTPDLGTISAGVGTALTALNGENILDDTIDDDSIDFSDVTLADFVDSTGTATFVIKDDGDGTFSAGTIGPSNMDATLDLSTKAITWPNFADGEGVMNETNTSDDYSTWQATDEVGGTPAQVDAITVTNAGVGGEVSVLLGDGTNGVKVDQSGDMTLNGTATFITTETEYLPVRAFEVDGTTDPGALTVEDNMAYRDFDDASDEDIEILWKIPTDLTGSTVKVRVIAVCTNATTPADTEGVSWGISACSSGTNDTHDCTVGTEVNSEDTDLDDDIGSQWDLMQFPWVEVTPTGLAGGEVMSLRVDRDTADSDDDYAQDIGLVGVEIAYQRTHDTAYSGL